MNVICPTDFSVTSINACHWILEFLEDMGGGDLHIVHCVNLKSRSSMFLKMDDLLTEQGEQDLKRLLQDLDKKTSHVKLTGQVLLVEPKSYITTKANSGKYDLVATGTKGLSALKNMTVGSVTEYIINHAKIPVITIPDQIPYKDPSTIVLGIDHQSVESAHTQFLADVCNRFDAVLKLVHVREKKEFIDEMDPDLYPFLDNITYEYESIELDDSIAESLSEYAEDIDADLLCMIHRKRTWWERIWSPSVTKSELFEIEKPVLII